MIGWDGEKELTFTVTDALLSPVGFAILSGAGLFKGASGTTEKVHYHMTTNAIVDTDGIDLTDALATDDKIDGNAPLYVILTEADGSITGEFIKGCAVDTTGKKITGTFTAYDGKTVMVDYYVIKSAAAASELIIDAENFSGYFYVEADTLFRDQATGVDLPANLTFPNVKIQSNFTFSMSPTGDPGTFDFAMDAFPGYTYFDKTRKVLCVIQILDDGTSSTSDTDSVMKHVDTTTDDSLLDEHTDSMTAASGS